MERRLWYIKNATLFSWLEEEEQMELARRSEMVSCRRNTRLFFAEEPSDNIYLVKEGRVKLTRANSEGKEVILDILGPGEIFGELALAGEDSRSHNAAALEDALVCIISREDFEDLLKRHPQLVQMKRLGLVKTSYRTIRLTNPQTLKKHFVDNSS